MKYYVETSLENFEAWSGGRDTLEVLIEKGLCDTVEACLEEDLNSYGEMPDDTAINDFLWFERDVIANYCGFSSWEDLENDGEADETDEADLEEAKDRLDECIEMEFENMVRCNNCMNIFHENEIIYDEAKDEEFCPYCGKSGCLMDVKGD